MGRDKALLPWPKNSASGTLLSCAIRAFSDRCELVLVVGGKNSPFNLGQSMNVTRKHGDFLLTLAKGFGSNVTAMGKGTSTIDGILKK